MVPCFNTSKPWNKRYNPEKDPSIERDIAFSDQSTSNVLL